jgi:hypothetical protein
LEKLGNAMADNRVVIRINYDKDQRRKSVIDPKMVTVWHTRRLLIAGFVLVLIAVPLLAWLFADGDRVNDVGPAAMEPVNNNAGTENQLPNSTVANQNLSSVNPGDEKAQYNKESKPVFRPSAIIFDKRVIRAALTVAQKDNKEPGEMVKLPVRIEANQSLELFYFSEVKGMKDKVLFHRWLKNGQVVYKKQLDIKDNKSKLISARTLTYKDSGDWQVVLVDRKGKLFSEANFSVNPQ